MNESHPINKNNAWKLRREGNPKASLAVKALAGAAALGLATGALGVSESIGQSRVNQSQAQNISKLEKDNTALAKQIANEQAKNITESLGNNPNNMVPATILEGTLVLKGKNGRSEPEPGYLNAIVLLANNDQKVTSYADVAWIGVQSPNGYMNGGIAIVPEEASEYSFVPASKQPVKEVYLYEQSGKDGNYIYSFDPTTRETLLNNDGTPESPGLPAEVVSLP